MLSLKLPLTRKSDAGPAAAPLWHPNFRNFERLPDTKVVRTTFFINAAAIALAASLSLWVGYREYHLHDINQQIDEAQAEIGRNQKQNAEAIRLSNSFAEEEKKLSEAQNFIRTPMPVTEFVLLLGQTLPKEVQIEFADMRITDPTSPQCILRGLVAGTKDQASGTASNYVDILRTAPRFAEAFDSVSLTALNTDPRTGLLNFEIILKFKKGKKS
ncbi:MAG: hypothetical protein HYV95_03855 [Opitutae bacterium]|nr:hypothetical protein [Opitutae bacterium]